MGIMGKKIAAIRAYVAEGGGADYHDQKDGHWIVGQLATPRSVYPKDKALRNYNWRLSGSMADHEPSGSLCSRTASGESGADLGSDV